MQGKSPLGVSKNNWVRQPGVSLRSWSGVVCFVCVSSVMSTAQAFENVDTWEKVRSGGKLCLRDHEHYGESPPWVSKKGALAAARRKWENFTTWEYGTKWGQLRLAASKRTDCRKAGTRWVCSIVARPCRR